VLHSRTWIFLSAWTPIAIAEWPMADLSIRPLVVSATVGPSWRPDGTADETDAPTSRVALYFVFRWMLLISLDFPPIPILIPFCLSVFRFEFRLFLPCLICFFFSLAYSFSSTFRSTVFLLSSICLIQESGESSHLNEQTIS
jgi:hypothetical protein